MTCTRDETSTCPFASTDASEIAQGFGCLPAPYDIIQMRIVHNKTWACHKDPSKPCVGAIEYLRDNGLPYEVIDSNLVTEGMDWSMYVNE